MWNHKIINFFLKEKKYIIKNLKFFHINLKRLEKIEIWTVEYCEKFINHKTVAKLLSDISKELIENTKPFDHEEFLNLMKNVVFISGYRSPPEEYELHAFLDNKRSYKFIDNKHKFLEQIGYLHSNKIFIEELKSFVDTFKFHK